MAETPRVPPPPAPAKPPSSDFEIGEEFSGAKRNLPPARMLLICLGAVALIVGIYAYVNRAKPQGGGSIDSVNAVDVAGQNSTMVAITLTLQNGGQKPLWIHTLKARLTAADDKTYDDDAASAVDFSRYFQAFPTLKENTEAPLAPETKLMPGTQQKGTIIVSFPVAKDAFDKRKSLAVTIQPYDQPLPIVLTK